MYFPVLENLKTKKFYEQDILLLDRWLGSRPKNTWKYLNPLQFALDCSINEELATNLFVSCTIDENIDLFEVRLLIKCPNCENVVAKEIGLLISGLEEDICAECFEELDWEILKDETEVYFSLKKQPAYPFRDKIIVENKTANNLDIATLTNVTDAEMLSKLFSIYA